MSKQRMIISDDQLLVDFELIFKAIKEEKGNWKAVEKEMRDLLESVQSMTSE